MGSFEIFKYAFGGLSGVITLTAATRLIYFAFAPIKLNIASLKYVATPNVIEELSAATHTPSVAVAAKNLAAIAKIYEAEIEDANIHLKSMNQFYATLSSAMQNLTEAGKDTEKFKNEIDALTGSLNSLNRVYGNMLSSVKSNAEEFPLIQGSSSSSDK